MDADLDTLATALYVTTDDLLKAHPERVPPRPRVGIAPRISDAELLTPAVMQALLGFTSKTRWLRHARAHLLPMFPHCRSSPATTSGWASSRPPWPGWSASSALTSGIRRCLSTTPEWPVQRQAMAILAAGLALAAHDGALVGAARVLVWVPIVCHAVWGHTRASGDLSERDPPRPVGNGLPMPRNHTEIIIQGAALV